MTLRTVTPDAPLEEVHKRLTDWLDAHATAAGHPFDNQPFNLELHDGDTVVAGFSGYRLYDWLFVRFIAVDPARRGQGLGARLVVEAEARVRAEGILGIFIDTYGYQAPGFYQRLGYTAFGTLGQPDPALCRTYLAKLLSPSAHLS